jgi:uncharacterized protein YeaO (DUF488 family)
MGPWYRIAFADFTIILHNNPRTAQLPRRPDVVKLKRAYDEPAASDGERYLVDRLWPRGIKKDAARLTGWLKDLAPSDELRQWFHRHPEHWPEFQSRYTGELQADPVKMSVIKELAARVRQGTVTLVFAAKDEAHNNAQVLKQVIENIQE